MAVQTVSKFIGLTDKAEPQEVLDLSVQENLNQVIQVSSIELSKEISSSLLIQNSGELFLQCPLATILDPSNVNPEAEKKFQQFEFIFSRIDQKREMLDKLNAYLQTCKGIRSAISDLCLAADELFTNAIFNAPGAGGEGPDTPVERTRKDIRMADGKTGRLFLGIDDSRIVLGCEDPYGSLNPLGQILRIRDCYIKGVGNSVQLDESGGAGIGSFLIFQLAMSFYSIVQSGKKTIICCTFPLNMGQRKRDGLLKNLHYLRIA
jgi:hypothetical protein